MKTRLVALSLVFVASSWLPLRAANEIGFIEKFAIASDREAVLKELIPGTEEYYFYHALHFQNTGKQKELDEVITQWSKRTPGSLLLREIRNRNALLNYEKDPAATIAYLKSVVGVSFNHFQQTLNPKPDLPVKVDDKWIAQDLFVKEALRDPNQLGGVTNDGLKLLLEIKAPLSGPQRRQLLSRVDRPDLPGLVDLILVELGTPESHGFGEFPIHANLLIDQLDALRKAKPELLTSGSFVHTWLQKLRPNADVNLLTNTKAREAWLDAAYAFVKPLAPGFNSIKAQILFARLNHDLKLGKLNSGRFLEYLKLPRNFSYVSARYREKQEVFSHPADLNADLRNVIGTPPVGEDESLVRAYLLTLLVDAADASTFAPYIEEGYLNQLLAEAKLTAGKGDAEKWFSLLSPTAVQQLRERVDLDFDRTNPEVIEPSQSVELNVHVKNVPHLTTSIYEINTLNYYRSSGQQVGTDLNLDGLVANVLQNADFAEAPILRVNRTLKFPQLDGKRGVWMIDLIGNGKSSRALIRKGQLHHVTRPSSAGTAITILDEALKPIPKATALVGGQEFTADERGEIMLPFSNQPGNQSVILTDGQGFAQLQQIDLQGENYQLTAGFHVAHESLVSGRKATLAIRPNLVVNGAPVDLKLLEEVKLTITSTNQDGINSTTTKPEFKLEENKEATFEFTVPERLTQLNFTLEAKVKSLITGEKVALTANGAQAVNSSDRSDLTADMYFSRTGSTYVVQVLGRSGEPRPEQVCAVRFFKNEFSEAIYRDLKTDAAGAITLGSLLGIDRVLVESTGLVSRTLTLPKDTFSSPENLHVAVGEKIVLPWMGSGNELDASFISLLETRQGGFVRNVLSEKTATLSGGYLILQNLEPGDYSLKYGSPIRAATIRVTQGKDAGSFLIGDGRMLERNAYQSLQVRSVAKGADSLVITLGGNGAEARVHVLVSHFVPDFNAFAALGNPPELQPLVGAPSSLKSLYLSGRTLGEEYRYVLDRRGEKKFPGSLLPRPGLLLNPWAVRETETSLDEAREGEKFAKLSDGQAAVAERAKKRPEMQKLDESLKRAAEQISSVNFLANTGATLFNLVPDKDGKVTIKLADLGDKQFVRILAVDGTSAVQRDISLDDAGTEIRNLALRNGLDPKGHFTRQNQVTILEKDVPYTIKDAATTQFELSDDLGKVFSLFGTLSNNPTLREFSFLLEWPTFDAAKKLELYSKYACHELTFFVQRKDPAFFKTVVLPYLANKRDKTFLDHYSLGNDLKSFLQPWSYGRLNTVERILLAQRHPEQAVVTARDIRELWEIKPVDQVMAWQRFDTALDDGRLEGGAAVRFGVVLDGLSVAEEKSVVRLAAAEKPANGPVAASAPAPPPPSAPMGAAAGRGGAKDKAEKANGRKSGAVVTNGALGVESELVAESDDAVSALKELKGRANRFAEQRDQAGKDMELRQKEMKAFYRQQPRTQEWAENNYYHVIIQQQLADLVKVNAFWRDYAAWNGKGGFLSEHITEAAGNFTEMMFALAVLDLPFPSQAKAPKAEQKDLALTLTPASRALLFHREIKPAEIDKDAPRLLVSQNFYRNGDRYVQKGNEKLDKFVTEEFLTGVIYGCQIVVTNPTSSTQKLELLLQIPQGALPVMGSKATDNVSVSLESYRTHTQDYFFYFPRVGKFDQHPVHVSKSEKVVAFAEPFQFNVVNELTKLDTASWEYVSQFGKPEEVLAFLEQNNLHRLDLVKMAWRLKDAGFFAKAIALLNQRHVFNSTVWSYGLMHQSLTEIGQFLQHVDGFINECGPTLTSKLIAIDTVARYSYEHLEYSPLVNARAHTLGTTRSILNDRLNGQYHSFLNVLAHQATLSEEDELALVYYLLLQDRVEEALETFAKVDGAKVVEKLQLDYLKAVLACYQSDTATARQIAALHEKEPVNRWREKFAEVLAQLDEIDGKKPAGAKEDDRDQRQNQLAANEPSLDFSVESREIKMKYRNIKEATVNYYAMDLEFLFSTAPFVSSDTSRFSMIQPTKTERVVLAADKDAHTLALPKEFHSSNVLVEITANGKSTARAYYANELNVVVSEGQGRIQVLHVGDNRPLAKTYVKVFAEINGQPKFYKDGYTDLRGKFDYLSLSTKELDQATRFSILVLNEQHGAAVKEVKPPQQ